MKKESEKLNEILVRLKDAETTADIDLEAWDPRTRAGMQIRKNQAKRDIVDFAIEYQQEVTKTVVKVFVSGSRDYTQKLTELLKKEGVNAYYTESVYEDIARQVEPMLGTGRIFEAAAYNRLIDTANEYARMFGLYSANLEKQPSFRAVKSDQDLVGLVKEATRAMYGDSLNKSFLFNRFIREAIANRFNTNVSLLVVSNATTEEQTTLSKTLFVGQPNFSVELSENEVPTKSTALKIFRKVSESFLKTNLQENTAVEASTTKE
jgi:hypothetical protein